MQIFPLSEGVFTIGTDKHFIPFDEAIHNLQDRSVGSLLVEIQPFLIQLNGKNIILDTGLGYKLNSGELQIHHNIRKIGIEPEQIHMVILSHLHKDHAGGISYSNSLGIDELSFPNAMYYISQSEFAFGIEKGFPSYIVDDFSLLKNSNQVEWLGEKGVISDFISYEKDGGHCPEHMSILLTDQHEKAFFGGDVVPQLRQLKSRYIAKYDFDGRRSMELRQEYAQKGKEENWTFLFYHDVKTPMSKLSF